MEAALEGSGMEEKNTEPVKSRETQSEKKDAAEQIVREENEAGKSSKGG